MKNVHLLPQSTRRIIERMLDMRILVLGDIMLDEFIWGKVTRISPEAPVPVVHVTKESACPGGAANVARNLADFGTQGYICGLAGRDINSSKLLSLLKNARINSDGILLKRDFVTIVKTRVVARQQQVVRVDRENSYQLSTRDLQKLIPILKNLLPTVDAVIIEDYGKGFITQDLVDFVISIARSHKKPITVDPNVNNPLQWRGATLIKPNKHEAFAVAGIPYADDESSLNWVGEKLMQLWQVPYLLITLGEDGMILFQQNKKPYFSPTRAREVYDVSGAGDTAIAFFTAALAAGASAEQATDIANHAAGVVVGKIGTATLTPDELINSFLNNE